MPQHNSANNRSADVNTKEKMESFLISSLGQEQFFSLAHFFLNIFFSAGYQKNTYAEKLNADYLIVFVTRRCHVLSQVFLDLFLQYVDMPTENQPDYLRDYPLKDLEEIARYHFITDSAFIAMADDLARRYMDFGEIPKILVCDEILIHGRALNSILSDLESRMLAYIQKEEGGDPTLDKLSYDRLMLHLAEKIDITVYAQNDKTILLYPRFQKKLRAMNLWKPTQWRDLSKCLSILVSWAGVSNIAYTFGLRISKNTEWLYNQMQETLWENPREWHGESFSKMILGKKNKSLIFQYFYPNASQPQAIGTVRIKKCAVTKDFLIVPFVILQDACVEKYQTLYRKILTDVKDTDYAQLFQADKFELLNTQKAVSNSKYFLEMISLFLGKLLFERFTKELATVYDIHIDADSVQVDALQMGRNYTRLSQMLGRNFPEKRPAEDEIQKFFKDVQWTKKPEATLENYLALPLASSSFIWRESLVLEQGPLPMRRKETNALIVRTIENIISTMGMVAEKEAYQLFMGEIRIQDKQFKKGSGLRSVEKLFAEIFQNIREQGIQLEPCYMLYALAFVIQIMSNGVIGMGAAEEDGMLYTNVRAGEQSLFIEPARYEEYLPVLKAIISTAEKNHFNVDREIDHFVNRIPEATPDLSDELKRFVHAMEETGQSLEEWDIVLTDSIHKMDQISGNIRDKALDTMYKQFEYLSLYRQI